MTRLNLSASEVNTLFPVVGVTAYLHGLVVRRCFNGQTLTAVRRTRRGRVLTLSRRSLTRLAFLVANCENKFYSLLTLTYGVNYPLNGRRVKSDINKFITYMRRSFGHFEYFWFIEFQKRGAPHFHFVSELPAPSRAERELFANLWASIAEANNLPYTAISRPYGAERAVTGQFTRDAVYRQHRRSVVWEALRSQDGAARYALKYALKTHQKDVPAFYRDVGRAWATSRGVRLGDGQDFALNERELRELAFWCGRSMDGFDVIPKIIFCKNDLLSTDC